MSDPRGQDEHWNDSRQKPSPKTNDSEIPDLTQLPIPTTEHWDSNQSEPYQQPFANANASSSSGQFQSNSRSPQGASSGNFRNLRQSQPRPSSPDQNGSSPTWGQATLGDRQQTQNPPPNPHSQHPFSNPHSGRHPSQRAGSGHQPLRETTSSISLQTTNPPPVYTTSNIMSPSSPHHSRQSSSLNQQSSFYKGMNSVSKLGSSVSRAFGGGFSSFARNRSSFVKSWSSQYIHGKVVPPITTSTITKEDATIPYPTNRFSKDYASFWWLIASFFIMFTAYSITLNLLTSVYGTNASLAIGILYAFFVLSSMAMPSINLIAFNNNTSACIFYGSFGNTFMMFCAIFGWFPLLLLGAIVVGCGGGFVWVGYNSILSIIARHIAEQDFLSDSRDRLHKRMKSTPQTREKNDERITELLQQLLLPNGRVNLLKITDEQLKRIILSAVQTTSWLTSIGWMGNSLNSVVGGFISWAVLSRGSNDDPVAAARPLFIIFFCLGVIANVVYSKFYRSTPVSMFASNEQPLQVEIHDPTRVNDNLDLVDAINDEGVIIHHSRSGMLGLDQADSLPGFISPAPNLDTVIEGGEEEEEDEDPDMSVYDPNNPLQKIGRYDGVQAANRRLQHHNTASMASITTTNSNTTATNRSQRSPNDDNNNNNNDNNNDNTNSDRSRSAKPLSSSNRGASTTSLAFDVDQSRISINTLTSPSDMSGGFAINIIGDDPSYRSSNKSGVVGSNGEELPLPPPSVLSVIARSLFMMKNLVGQRVIALSLVSWYQMLFPITLAVSFLTAASIKPTLGTQNVAVYMMLVYFVDAAAALLLSKVLNGFKSARIFGIVGSGIQLIFALAVVFLPSSGWIDPAFPNDKAHAWTVAIILGAIAGVGDALMQSGTNAALGLVVEGSILIRSGGFGICQVMKSSGSITIFLLARLVSFQTQTAVVVGVLVTSLVFQVINFMFHLPLDQDYLVAEYKSFIQRQEDAVRADLIASYGDSGGERDDRPSQGGMTPGTNLDDLQGAG